MRIAIREQVVLLVTLTVLVALGVVALPTWFFVHRFVIEVRKDALSLTASLKASRITSELDLVRSNCRTIASRLLIQAGLKEWSNGTRTDWSQAREDLAIALSARSQTNLLQAKIYTRDGSGDEGGIVNVTGINSPSIKLPFGNPRGGPAYLGDDSIFGFPPQLYPNITYVNLNTTNPSNNLTEFDAFAFGSVNLTQPSGLLLGPLSINESFALMSLTLPIRDNNQLSFPIGFLTIVASAVTLVDIVQSREGLGTTGIVLLVGPDEPANRFNQTVAQADMPQADPDAIGDKNFFKNVLVHYLLPATRLPDQEDRHPTRTYAKRTSESNFPLKDYPAALRSWTERIPSVNNASAMLSTTNEEHGSVAVGFARTNTTLANWTVLVEQTRKEAYGPIMTLRKILLGCVFGTAGVIFALTYPCAHVGVMPIRRLKAATEKTVSPPGYEDDYFSPRYGGGNGETPGSGQHSQSSQGSIKGWFWKMLTWMGYKPTPPRKKKPEDSLDSSRRVFKIPGKVVDRKHFITDELTELTTTFNDMSDELLKQYTLLDEKVAARTRELEVSKKAAEAANESKTLFIANISHELKTPLNGILGMCAVCMEEDDLGKIKQSLRTLYKSGDLLLHLLEDLLSFSKNQIGQQLSLEQKEFKLADIRSQILIIFDKQVREGNVNFSVNFLSTDSIDLEKAGTEPKMPAIGPQGTGKLRDMCLWGDQHRILQVLINLVSNSLKFTPKGGRVQVRIKCLGDVEEIPSGPGGHGASRSSSTSKNSGRGRSRIGSTSTRSASSRGLGQGQGGSVPAEQMKGTALSINPMEPKQSSQVYIRGRSPTPPPANAKSYLFEFEVEDSGPGIRPEMQQRVFEPFMQGDPGLSKKFGGTGLGLSICQQLATIMGGNITLTSTIGVGSTFTMRIPLKFVRDRSSSTASSSIKSCAASVDGIETESAGNSVAKTNGDGKSTPVLDTQPRLVGLRQPFFTSTPTPSPPPPAQTTEAKMARVETALARKTKYGGGKLRVLVADDNSTNIEVVSRMLKLEDIYDVTIAKDGQEAFDRVKDAMADHRPFDVIFMDVQMPNLDGLQSTRKIRQIGYKSPIVALTAFSEESNVRECIESGMDEFLSKPIRRPALKQVLQKFSTIPEEPESAATTPGETTAGNSVMLDGVPSSPPVINGNLGGEKDGFEVVEKTSTDSTATPPSSIVR